MLNLILKKRYARKFQGTRDETLLLKPQPNTEKNCYWNNDTNSLQKFIKLVKSD